MIDRQIVMHPAWSIKFSLPSLTWMRTTGLELRRFAPSPGNMSEGFDCDVSLSVTYLVQNESSSNTAKNSASANKVERAPWDLEKSGQQACDQDPVPLGRRNKLCTVPQRSGSTGIEAITANSLCVILKWLHNAAATCLSGAWSSCFAE